MKIQRTSFIGPLIYTGISVIVSGLFLIITTIQKLNLVARIGGTVWVFILCMIILMPIITPLIKKKF